MNSKSKRFITSPKTDSSYDYTIAIAGNPNVGKSSIFNQLTGMHQHTGNWPGKTVSNAIRICSLSKESLPFCGYSWYLFFTL